MEVINIAKDKIPIGLDLVDESVDFSKSLEENNKLYRERYKKVYGEYPPNFKQLREEYKDSPEDLKQLDEIIEKIEKI